MQRPGQGGGAAAGGPHPATVRAFLPDGRLKATWQGRLLAGPGWWALAADWSRPAADVEAFRFEPGDRLIEVFWPDRWYNVIRVAAPGGGLKGYYLNVASPARLRRARRPDGPWELVYTDGVLDAVVVPGGRWWWLDRQDFRRLLALDASAQGRTGPAGHGAPDPCQWAAAARRLGRQLASGAGRFVQQLVPWDELVRVLVAGQGGHGG